MEWLEYFQLYDSLEEKKIEEEEKSGCDHDYIMDQVLVCFKCGEVSPETIYSEVLDAKHKKNHHLYYRKTYFLNRLHLMNRNVQCSNEIYNQVLDILRNKKFETIRELRSVMKRLKLRSYYKYIYSIFYDLKGVKVFQFNADQIDGMVKTFLKMERNFKEKYPGKRNLFNYNLIIYYVLRIHRIDCDHDSIIFPHNERKVLNIIDNLL